MATETDSITETNMDAAREILRRELAKKAARRDALLAEDKAIGASILQHDETEKARRKAADDARKALLKKKSAVQAAAQAANNADGRLRQEFVPLEVRQAVSAAEGQVGAAKLALRHAEQDLAVFQLTLKNLRDRFKSVPSPGSGKDIQDAIKRAEADCLAPEARAAAALEAVRSAEARMSIAQGAFDAAMSAARAL